MRIYRRENLKKLNTVVLVPGGSWQEQWKILDGLLQSEGYVCISRSGQAPMRLQREHTIVLTDSEAQARRFGGEGFVCVGCAGPGGSFFDGAGMVLETPEAADFSELEEYLCHMLGEAVLVAETSRLIIKEISADEIDSLCAVSRQCDQRFLRMLGEEDFFDEQRLRSYIREVYRLYGYGLWSVRLKDKAMDINASDMGSVIGCCGLSDVFWEDGKNRVELQYMLGETYRRQGYGYEMCREALKQAPERAGCETVWMRIHPDNLPSIKLAQKLGFCRAKEQVQCESLIFFRRCAQQLEEV